MQTADSNNIDMRYIRIKIYFNYSTLCGLQDFQDRTTILQQVVQNRGHMCLYLPKFHCELNPIESVWCHSKKHTRGHCNGTIVRLRKIVPESLSLVCDDTIGRFFARCRDFEAAYRNGHTCTSVDAAVKLYKSHRRVTGVK